MEALGDVDEINSLLGMVKIEGGKTPAVGGLRPKNTCGTLRKYVAWNNLDTITESA